VLEESFKETDFTPVASDRRRASMDRAPAACSRQLAITPRLYSIATAVHRSSTPIGDADACSVNKIDGLGGPPNEPLIHDGTNYLGAAEHAIVAIVNRQLRIELPFRPIVKGSRQRLEQPIQDR